MIIIVSKSENMLKNNKYHHVHNQYPTNELTIGMMTIW